MRFRHHRGGNSSRVELPPPVPSTPFKIKTNLFTGNSGSNVITTGLDLTDSLGGLIWIKNRGSGDHHSQVDTVRGIGNYIQSSATTAQQASATMVTAISATGFTLGANNLTNFSGESMMTFCLKFTAAVLRAITYVGTGAVNAVAHPLTVAPEVLMIKKIIGTAASWQVYFSSRGNTKFFTFNSSNAESAGAPWNSTTPGASTFTVDATAAVNNTGDTYLALLWASKTGELKIGQFVGTGALLSIDCGFTTGMSWLLIKNVAAGDWYIWDSVRGMTSGNDPFVVNTTAIENAATNYVESQSIGFFVNAAASATVNIAAATYVYIAAAI